MPGVKSLSTNALLRLQLFDIGINIEQGGCQV